MDHCRIIQVILALFYDQYLQIRGGSRQPSGCNTRCNTAACEYDIGLIHAALVIAHIFLVDTNGYGTRRLKFNAAIGGDYHSPTSLRSSGP
jgi:hypothetical protein